MDNYPPFIFFADVYHMWSLERRMSMNQECPTPMPLLKHFKVVPWNRVYFNSCYDGHAEVFSLRQSNSNSLLWASIVFTYSFYHLHLSGIRSWFSFGNHISLGHVVLVKRLPCPTCSETRRIFSKICFCKIYSC